MYKPSIAAALCLTFATSALASPEMGATQFYRTGAPKAEYRKNFSGTDGGLTFVLMTGGVAAPIMGTDSAGLSITGTAPAVLGTVALGIGLTLTVGKSIWRFITGTRATVSATIGSTSLDRLPLIDQGCSRQFESSMADVLKRDGIANLIDKKNIAKIQMNLISVDRNDFKKYNRENGQFEINRPSYVAHVVEEIAMGRKRSFKNIQTVAAQTTGNVLFLNAYAMANGKSEEQKGAVCLVPTPGQIQAALSK